jgi:organic radical activating enzyme
MTLKKGEFPYLVDIKITSKCNHRCWWCYADACDEVKGTDADASFVANDLSRVLKQARVFEVVIGGGEPTLYNNDKKKYYELSQILNQFQNKDFKVSMTTRNYNWYKLKDFAEAIAAVDAVAISCETVSDLLNARTLVKSIREVERDGRNIQIVIQKILQLYSIPQLQFFLNRCLDLDYYNVTLLGFKHWGRALGTARWHNSKWVEMVRKSGLNIGVDSALVQEYGEELKDAGVPGYMVQGQEGKQTCYIDAVAQTIYPSSTSSTGIPFKFAYGKEAEGFLEVFSKL